MAQDKLAAVKTGRATITDMDKRDPALMAEVEKDALASKSYKKNIANAKTQTQEFFSGSDFALMSEWYPDVAAVVGWDNPDSIAGGHSIGDESKGVSIFENIIRPLREGDFSGFPELAGMDERARQLYVDAILQDAELQMMRYLGYDKKAKKRNVVAPYHEQVRESSNALDRQDARVRRQWEAQQREANAALDRQDARFRK
jgi:hypothetical protein